LNVPPHLNESREWTRIFPSFLIHRSLGARAESKADFIVSFPPFPIQRGTAFLTTSTNPERIQQNFDLSTVPEDAMQEMRDGIKTNIRFNTAVTTGVPGFIPG
jgi:diketogulonate reductase-like aldo/keto reductase